MTFWIQCCSDNDHICNGYYSKQSIWDEIMLKYFNIDYFELHKNNKISTEEIKKYYEKLKSIEDNIIENNIDIDKHCYNNLINLMKHSIEYNHYWVCG